MANHTAHNRAIMRQGLTDYTKRKIQLTLVNNLRRIAQRIVGVIDGSFSPDSAQFPVYSGNLHDATGVAVYVDGMVSSFIPVQRASEPQEYGYEFFFGNEELRKAIALTASKCYSDVWIVLFSSVPYASRINDIGSPKSRGVNYFGVLEGEMFNAVLYDIIMGLRPV